MFQVSSPPGSVSHSRIPSLVDENTDNYLSMVPQSHSGEPSHSEISARDRTEAYLNMTPTPALPTPIPYSPSEGLFTLLCASTLLQCFYIFR